MTQIDQGRTIAFLSRPDSYGAADEIARVETHAAIVFLVGDKAYKLKRAVKYTFLDYSTTELREQSARAELALNRRTAPELYLDAIPVNLTGDGRLSLNEAGDAVDWLVIMRRFKEEDLLSRIADEGEIPRPLLQNLADRIVAFHDSANVRKDRGGAEAMRSVIELNNASMREHPAILPSGKVDALQRASLAALSSIAALLDHRSENDFVRHCHGDLHLRNICLVEGEPVLFDCIEFSDALACIDILYDLAFLLMDLWCRNHRAEANFVFNRYLDMSDDGAEGIAALPLFLSMRAAVRAHVMAATASLSASTSDARLARKYLDDAIEFLRTAEPAMVAIGGLSGTGKSTLAYALAPSLGNAPGARVLRSDVIRKRLMNLAPESRLSDAGYSPDITARVYAEICGQAGKSLATGYSVIVDAVFASQAERAAIMAVASATDEPFRGLWLQAPVVELEQRLANRTGDASDATVAVLDRQLRYEIGSLDEWRRIDASGDPGITFQAAKLLLRQLIV